MKKISKLTKSNIKETTLFFFNKKNGHNFLKRKDKKEINDFASFIHNDNPCNFFIHFINEANKKDNEERDLLFSYIYGLLNHYVLDRITHPYVFYHSGIDKDFMKKHQKFETNIDVLLRTHFNNFIKPSSTIKVDINDVTKLSLVYSSFDSNLKDDTFIKAYKDIYNIQNVLYSKHGFKKWIYHTFLRDSTIDNTSMPKKITDGIDYLNTQKKLWQHPTKNFKMSLSFFELLDLSKEEEWASKANIQNYYDAVDQSLDAQIAAQKKYLESKNLSEEEYQQTKMAIAELEREKHNNALKMMQDTQAFYDKEYNAMTYMVNEYITALSEEKESISETYDEEIDKLQKVNDAKERKIKLKKEGIEI